MKKVRIDYSSITDMLIAAGLRPTRQRLLLANILFSKGCRHVAADALHREAKSAGIDVALATVYNTLHQFSEAGLVSSVSVDDRRSYFDTNTADHHHFHCQDTGALIDIPAEQVRIDQLPFPPPGKNIQKVSVFIKLKAAS